MKINRLFLITCLLFTACEPEEEPIVCEDPIVTNSLESCCETAALEGIIGEASFYVANVFTPDFDGVNDLFFVQANAEEIAKVKVMRIRNVLDSLVFEQLEFPPNDPSFAWDGSVGGLILRGVYTYEMDLEAINGETETFVGEVCA